jgi:ATP-binding cassette subfamily B protein
MRISGFSIRRLLPVEQMGLIKPHWGRLGLGLALLLLTVATQLAYPWLIAYFIDHSLDRAEARWLTGMVAILAAVLVLEAAAVAAHSYLFSSAGTLIVFRLRMSLFGAIVRQEIAFFDAESVGGLTSRLSSDAEQLRRALSGNLGMLVQSALTAAGGAFMLFTLSPELSLSLLLVALPLLLVTRWTGRRMREISKMRQQKLADCGHLAQEAISNIRLVHAYTQQVYEEEQYARAATSAQKASLSGDRVTAGFCSAISLLQGMMMLVLLWIGIVLIQKHSLTVGNLAGFAIYAFMVTGSANIVGAFWSEWMQSVGATQRVFEIMRRKPRTRTAPEGSVARLRGDIEFRDVTFAYPTRTEQLALDGFGLSVSSGERIALVGPSGAGKSTVINLLLGFYEPLSGGIRFDGIAAEKISLCDLRRHIAIVEQEPALFAGSILENIRYAAPGGTASEQDVIAAAKHANVHDFVAKLPMGYATRVGNRGLQLSGGQKQRIAIARALLRNPRILVLDEATSALDSENEDKVQAALHRLMQGRTTIIVAHRLSTIAYADRVVVMNAGRIVQMGTHGQLLADRSGRYFTLMKNQIPSECIDRAFERQLASSEQVRLAN